MAERPPRRLQAKLDADAYSSTGHSLAGSSPFAHSSIMFCSPPTGSVSIVTSTSSFPVDVTVPFALASSAWMAATVRRVRNIA